MKGEAPAGVNVETTNVTGQYTDFDPKAYTLSVTDTAAFLSGEPESRRSAEGRYKVLAAYDISLSLNGGEYQPEPGKPLQVSMVRQEKNFLTMQFT